MHWPRGAPAQLAGNAIDCTMARWQAVRLPMGAGAVGRMPLTPPHLCACPADKNNKREHRGFGFVTFETEAAIQVGGQAEVAGCSQSGAAAQPTPDAAYQHACCRCCLPGLPLPCTQRAPCSLALFTQRSLPLCLLSPMPAAQRVVAHGPHHIRGSIVAIDSAVPRQVCNRLPGLHAVCHTR